MADPRKVVTSVIKSTPAGGVLSAVNGLLGGLGIGKGASDKKYAARQATQKRNIELATQGDVNALYMLGAIGRLAKLPVELGPPYTSGGTLPKGWTSKEWGVAYDKLIQRAANAYRNLAGQYSPNNGNQTQSGGGISSPGTAPGTGAPTFPPAFPPAPTELPNSGAGQTRTWAGSAPSVPTTPKPCPPGKERNPLTGRCRNIVSAIPAPFSGMPVAGPKPCAPGKERNPVTGRCVSPCKYGPRGPDGLCPKKPSGGYYGGAPNSRPTKAEQAALKRAVTAAEKVVGAGVAGAGKAIKAGLAGSGISAGAAATTVAAVAAAAVVGWLLGRALDKALSGETMEQVRANLGVSRNHARAALAKQLGVFDENTPGVGLTKEQQKPIDDWYKKALAATYPNNGTTLTETASPDAVAYDLWKSKLNAGA